MQTDGPPGQSQYGSGLELQYGLIKDSAGRNARELAALTVLSFLRTKR